MAEYQETRAGSAWSGVVATIVGSPLCALALGLSVSLTSVDARAADCSGGMLDRVQNHFKSAGGWRVAVDRSPDCEFSSAHGWSIKTRYSPSMAQSAVDELTEMKDLLGASDDASSPEGRILGSKVEKWISSIKRNHYDFNQTSDGEMKKVPSDFVVIHFGSGRAAMLVNMAKPHSIGHVDDAERAELARLGLDFWALNTGRK